MTRNSRNILLLVFTVVLSGVSFGQTKQQRNVTINGQNGTAQVIDQNGRLFVDVLALANIGKGSVSFTGPAIVLTFPSSEPFGDSRSRGVPCCRRRATGTVLLCRRNS